MHTILMRTYSSLISLPSKVINLWLNLLSKLNISAFNYTSHKSSSYALMSYLKSLKLSPQVSWSAFKMSAQSISLMKGDLFCFVFKYFSLIKLGIYSLRLLAVMPISYLMLLYLMLSMMAYFIPVVYAMKEDPAISEAFHKFLEKSKNMRHCAGSPFQYLKSTVGAHPKIKAMKQALESIPEVPRDFPHLPLDSFSNSGTLNKAVTSTYLKEKSLPGIGIYVSPHHKIKAMDCTLNQLPELPENAPQLVLSSRYPKWGFPRVVMEPKAPSEYSKDIWNGAVAKLKCKDVDYALKTFTYPLSNPDDQMFKMIPPESIDSALKPSGEHSMFDLPLDTSTTSSLTHNLPILNSAPDATPGTAPEEFVDTFATQLHKCIEMTMSLDLI